MDRCKPHSILLIFLIQEFIFRFDLDIQGKTPLTVIIFDYIQKNNVHKIMMSCGSNVTLNTD